MENILISVIIPCYKVEDYIRTCVDSIIIQTYKNLEIFLVDDGSPDRCGEICDEYAKKDHRIKVIHKKNGGLSDARNVAIDVAQGEYITFVDSDDYVTPDYVESLYNLIVGNNAQMSVTWCLSFKEGTQPIQTDEVINTKVFNANEAIANMFYQKDFDNAAWAKMYHRSLFDTGIRYPKGWIYEDLATTYRLMQHCSRIAFSNYKNYYYLLRNNSIEGAPFKVSKFECCVKIISQLEKDKISMPILIQKGMECRIVSFAFHILLEIPKEQIEIRRRMFDVIKKYRCHVLFDKNARKKARVASLLSFISMSAVDSLAKYGKLRK